jgi:protein-arginine kinase activator protein McsA
MLPFNNPPRSRAQAESKSTSCIGGCGSTVFYRTNPRKHCDTCRLLLHKERSRISAAKKRRRNGIPQVKGTLSACDKCGTEFIRSGRTHRFCSACAPSAYLEYSREYQRRKHRRDGREKIGTKKPCKNCGNEFERLKKGRQLYCAPCMRLQKANRLPSLRVSFGAWRRKRYATDPSFALNELMRRGVLKSLKPGAKGGRSWRSLVGYTSAELRRHIERQFLPGMSWDKRSEIHIDHIVPLSLFKFDGPDHPEFKAAWALTNLRPLWASDNIRKRSRRTHLL